MRIIQSLRTYTRQRRKLRFLDFISRIPRSGDQLRIVDIGGTVPFWTRWWGLTEQDNIHVTLVNDHTQDQTDDEECTMPFLEEWRTDATLLTVEDFSRFDCVFSNSCIEHLSSWDDQKSMAAAIMASGLPYFIQVPNKFAPIDPHYPRPYVPFFGCYPKALQRRLLMISALGSDGKHSYESATEVLKYYNPLGVGDMRALFPAADLVVEKPMGVPMSILTYRTAPARPGGSPQLSPA